METPTGSNDAAANDGPDAVPFDASADSPSGSDSLESQLAQAIAERDTIQDKFTRSLAETENYRRRIQREQDDDRKYQALPLIRAVLPGIDGLVRAMQAAQGSGKLEELLKGLEMVTRQFENTLAGFGAKPIESVGQAFDPNRHEAIQQLPSPDHPAMQILMEVEKGYTLHDRVIRPSKVIVSSGPPA